MSYILKYIAIIIIRIVNNLFYSTIYNVNFTSNKIIFKIQNCMKIVCIL